MSTCRKSDIFHSLDVRKSYATPITKTKPSPNPNTNPYPTNPNCNIKMVRHLFSPNKPKHHPNNAMFVVHKHITSGTKLAISLR